MSEKTEPPSPKRLRDAREKEGNVLVSKEIISTAIFLGIMASLAASGSFMFKQIIQIFDTLFQAINLDPTTAMNLMGGLIYQFVLYAFIFSVAVGLLVAIAANVAQFGFLLTLAKFQKGFESLDMVKNAENIFTKRNFFGFLFNIFKVIIVGFSLYFVIHKFIKDLIYSPACGVNCVLTHGLYAFLYFIIIIAVAFVIVAGVDFLVQRHFYLEGLMMSHEELKQEHKESEGSHEIKGHRREFAHELLNDDHAGKVANSTAVVKNPTHYAVAIFYERGVSPLPLITTKGADTIAQEILRYAEKYNIPVIEDIGLAQALYFYGQIDQYIPTDLFKPVADFLQKAEQIKNNNL